MKQTINSHDFKEAFRSYGRQDNFSYAGLDVLFEYFEELENDTGEEIELDVVAICCEYEEAHWTDIADNYSIDLEDCEGDEEKIEVVRDYLNDNTMICGMVGEETFVFVQF